MEFKTDRSTREPWFCGAKQCLGWLNYRESPEKREVSDDELDSE
jgi:hypothetical protein